MSADIIIMSNVYNGSKQFNNRGVLSGFHSFDGDSLPDYSEFDSESVTLEYLAER